MSITLPLSLSQLTWASEEAPPANPRWAYTLLQVTGEQTNRRLPCHQAKNRINKNIHLLVRIYVSFVSATGKRSYGTNLHHPPLPLPSSSLFSLCYWQLESQIYCVLFLCSTHVPSLHHH